MDWRKFVILQLLLGSCAANSFFSFLYELDERSLIISKWDKNAELFVNSTEATSPATDEATSPATEEATETTALGSEEPTWATDETTLENSEGTTSAEENTKTSPSNSEGTTVAETTKTSPSNSEGTTQEPITTTSDIFTTMGSSTTTVCKQHDAQCTSSKECCGIVDMSCWDHPSLPYPMCKCDLYFSWDEDRGRCVEITLSEQMMMAAFMAFSSAILVAMIAFCVHTCKNWRGYRDRVRYMRQDRRTRARRQQIRIPRQQNQHNLSVFVLKENQPGGPDEVKLPAYEEIEAHQVVYTTMVTTMPTNLLPNMSVSPPEYDAVIAEIRPTVEVPQLQEVAATDPDSTPREEQNGNRD